MGSGTRLSQAEVRSCQTATFLHVTLCNSGCVRLLENSFVSTRKCFEEFACFSRWTNKRKGLKWTHPQSALDNTTVGRWMLNAFKGDRLFAQYSASPSTPQAAYTVQKGQGHRSSLLIRAAVNSGRDNWNSKWRLRLQIYDDIFLLWVKVL